MERLLFATVYLVFQVTIDIPYASPPQGMKYFTIIGPHIDCMDEQYLVSEGCRYALTAGYAHMWNCNFVLSLTYAVA